MIELVYNKSTKTFARRDYKYKYWYPAIDEHLNIMRQRRLDNDASASKALGVLLNLVRRVGARPQLVKDNVLMISATDGDVLFRAGIVDPKWLQKVDKESRPIKQVATPIIKGRIPEYYFHWKSADGMEGTKGPCTQDEFELWCDKFDRNERIIDYNRELAQE